MSVSEPPTVLIVDDDPQVRDLYARVLEDAYRTRCVDSGEAALEELGDHIDVVLLDRRMLGMSGGDVLIRLREGGFEQPVAMVTAVEPDFDVLELGFDGYLVKPLEAGELEELVESLLLRQEYDDVIREYFALVSKVTALQQRKSSDALEANGSYADSSARLEAIKEQAHAALDTAIETGKFDELFYDTEVGEVEQFGISAE